MRALDHPPALRISVSDRPAFALYEVEASLPLLPEKCETSTPASETIHLTHLPTVALDIDLCGFM